MAGLGSFGRQITAAINGMMPPAQREAEVRRLAGDVLRQAQEANRRELGFVPPNETFVDGRKVPYLGKINPEEGTIAFVFEIDTLSDIVLQAHKMLVENSPVLSGEYQRSHKILADGRDLTDAMPDPTERGKVREWVLLNPLPYSRKIEQGRMTMRVPGTDAVYEGVAAIMSRRAGRKANVWFAYRSPDSAYVAGGANRAERSAIRGQPKRIAAMKAERASRVPAIIITAP